jgi:dienelactone hydrolase
MGASLGTGSLVSHSLDAPPPNDNAPFPVLLFSAAGFSPLSYAGIVEELASHGYVVASICHTYEAPVAVFPSGGSAAANPEYLMRLASNSGDHEAAFAFRAGVALLKRDDLAFAAGAIGNSSPLSNLIDLDRLGAFGHSLGGNAALEFCRTDERCRAAVNLDGANWTEVGRAGLPKPALILACEHPEMLVPPEGLVAAGVYPDVAWALAERAVLFDGWEKVAATGRPGALRTIEGARHANFADLQFVSLPEGSQLRGLLGPIAPDVMWRRTCDELLEFFSRNLS